MKTIKVTRHTRKMIDSYREEGESVDECISRLLKSTEPLPKMDRRITNIGLKEETFNILVGYKSWDGESHSDTIRRLLERVGDK